MAEEPCQCSDCQRFYKEHDRLIREFPTFKQPQELSWTSIQSFRPLCNKVTDQMQRQLSKIDSYADVSPEGKEISGKEITEGLDELESVNAYLFSIEALREKFLKLKFQIILN